MQPNAPAVARRVHRSAHNKGRANDKFIAFLVIIKASIAQRWYERVLDADVFEVAVGWYETAKNVAAGEVVLDLVAQAAADEVPEEGAAAEVGGGLRRGSSVGKPMQCSE